MLCNEVTRILGLENYKGESVIVNYYKESDYMNGHLDDGEPDQENPILSFSIGLSCVFLVGGPTKETSPLAIQLDSGDLIVMSQQAWWCFHGVAKVMKNSFKEENYEIQDELSDRNT